MINKELTLLKKLNTTGFNTLTILYKANIKIYTEVKNTESNLDYITLDERTTGVMSTTSLAGGYRKIQTMCDKVKYEEGDTFISYNLSIKPGYKEVLRLINMDKICDVNKKSKELGYALFTSSVYSLSKSVKDVA